MWEGGPGSESIAATIQSDARTSPALFIDPSVFARMLHGEQRERTWAGLYSTFRGGLVLPGSDGTVFCLSAWGGVSFLFWGLYAFWGREFSIHVGAWVGMRIYRGGAERCQGSFFFGIFYSVSYNSTQIVSLSICGLQCDVPHSLITTPIPHDPFHRCSQCGIPMLLLSPISFSVTSWSQTSQSFQFRTTHSIGLQ